MSASHFTPGWNDPPQGTIAATNSTNTANDRALFNRRVAFPQTNTDPAKSAVANDGAPNVPNMVPPTMFAGQGQVQQQPLMMMAVPGMSTQSEAVLSASVQHQPIEVEPNNYSDAELYSLLAGYLDRCSNLQAAQKQNIVRRLEKLRDSLSSSENGDGSQMSPACRLQLCRLVTLTEKEMYSAAFQIHTKMMLEHISEVKLWMPGVKAILLELQKP